MLWTINKDSGLVTVYLNQTEGVSTFLLAVGEITKSSNTFSATNISSNIIWLLQLHDTIQMKSNNT